MAMRGLSQQTDLPGLADGSGGQRSQCKARKRLVLRALLALVASGLLQPKFLGTCAGRSKQSAQSRRPLVCRPW